MTIADSLFDCDSRIHKYLADGLYDPALKPEILRVLEEMESLRKKLDNQMVEMSFENLGNLEMVLAYLHGEEQNYEEHPDEHHIWLNIKPLKEWLEAEQEKIRLAWEMSRGNA